MRLHADNGEETMSDLSSKSMRYECRMDDESESRVRSQINKFNGPFREQLVERMGPNWPGAQPLQIYAVDSGGELIGGIIGETHAVPMWAEIELLWVSCDFRGSGIGRRLVCEAEERATAASCEFIRLSTASFQAPEFYERLGYTRYGRLADCPPGEELLLYFKRLESVG